MEKIVLTFLASLGFVPALVQEVSAQADPSTPLGTGPLPSWNDGMAKKSIIDHFRSLSVKSKGELPIIPVDERAAEVRVIKVG